MRVDFSKGCAWRAIYLSRALTDEFGFVGRHQFFHISVDPTAALPGPRLSWSLRNPWKRGAPGQRWAFSIGGRIGLPHLRWRSEHERRFLPGYLTLWRISSKFWASLDGRRSLRAAQRKEA